MLHNSPLKMPWHLVISVYFSLRCSRISGDSAWGFQGCVGQSALPHIPALGLRLEGHGLLRHVLSIVLWFRRTRGTIQTGRHILNLDHVMFANIPLSKVRSQ